MKNETISKLSFPRDVEAIERIEFKLAEVYFQEDREEHYDIDGASYDAKLGVIIASDSKVTSLPSQ